jgi:alpha-L-fucosidase
MKTKKTFKVLNHFEHAGIIIAFILTFSIVPAQEKKNEIWEVLNQNTDGPAAISPLPTELQLKYQYMEKQLFIHFTVNNFTGKQWGDGTEHPDDFAPTDLDPEQWVKLAKETGYNTICLTAKHHDGFCLWPSKYTEHSVKNSKWKNGKGDVLRVFSDACKKYGVNISYYLSPWDRHDKRYGTAEYNDYFINQLKELMIEYGPVKGFWFDGAFGGSTVKDEGKYMTPFAWAEYYKVIRKYAPDAFIEMMGPDVGWVANEAAVSPKENWYFESVPYRTPSGVRPGKFPVAYIGSSYTQQDEDDVKAGGQPNYKATELLRYMPREANTSIIPAWFWEPSQKPKSPQELRDTYFSSIGRGSTLMLNLSPDYSGQFPQDQVMALKQLDKEINTIFAKNFAKGKKAIEDKMWNNNKNYSAKNILDGKETTYWAGKYQDFTGSIEVDIKKSQTVNVLELREPVYMGQRVSLFKVQYLDKNNNWKELYKGTTIGYKRLIRFPAITAQKFKIIIEDSRSTPLISSFGLYFNPYDKRTDAKDYDPKKTKTGTKEEEAI